MSFSNARIGELESQLSSKISKFDETAARLVSTKLRLRIAEDAVSLMLEQVESQEPQICEAEAACVAAKVERAAE